MVDLSCPLAIEILRFTQDDSEVRDDREARDDLFAEDSKRDVSLWSVA